MTYAPGSVRVLRQQSGTLALAALSRQTMRKTGLLYRIRSFIADAFGISDDQARNGAWWEIDLIIVVLGAAIIVGGLAWTQL